MKNTTGNLINIAILISLYSTHTWSSEAISISLCNPEERVIISFKIENKSKYASICSKEDTYITYRYGSQKNIELEYPNILNKTSWNRFKFYGYSRAGGARNDAMGDYSLSFTNHETQYTIIQSWRDMDKEYNIGILVDTGKKRAYFKGNAKSQLGSLTRLEGNSTIKNQYE
jgi:hypothetical protein